MRILFILFLFISISAKAQHTGFSFELMNEIGTYKLVSLTFSHETDNTEGVSYIIQKESGDTVYHLDQFLNGYVALSNDGRTIAHLVTEKENNPLPAGTLTFFRKGKQFDSAALNRFIKYELDETTANNKLPKSGWLRNDSLLNKMAINPFYVTDDKVYMSFDKPLLMVFDMNLMFHVYSGNGANHFFQNYYAIPNAPYRNEFDSDEYSPKAFPTTSNGEIFESFLSKTISGKITDKTSAKAKVSVTFKLTRNGAIEIRKAKVEDIKSGKLDEEKSALLKSTLAEISFIADILPHNHPVWIFSDVFWIK